MKLSLLLLIARGWSMALNDDYAIENDAELSSNVVQDVVQESQNYMDGLMDQVVEYMATQEVDKGTDTMDLVDEHVTNIDMIELPPFEGETSSNILFTIDRIDTLLNENEDLMGARYQHIVISMTVDDDGTLLVNGQAVPLNEPFFEIWATSLSSVSATNEIQATDILNQFDEGILNVKVDASAKDILVDGEVIRRIAVVLKIVQLDDLDLQIDEYVEKILEVRPSGLFSTKATLSDGSTALELLDQPQEGQFTCHSPSSFKKVLTLLSLLMMILSLLTMFSYWMRASDVGLDYSALSKDDLDLPRYEESL